MTQFHGVSLVATVKDEYGSLPGWLAALDAQLLQPDEYVIVDGGSTDGTWELLDAWQPASRKHLLQLPGSTIAEGRNIAFAHATGTIIAITDCGTLADPDWLRRLTEPLVDESVDVSAGAFRPHTRTWWERSLAATTLPDIAELDQVTFLPSSRSVAVRRSWIEQGFVYPGWLDYCEDLVWDLQLKRGGARFALADGAVVGFRPRANAWSYVKQYYRYARGDGKAGLFSRRHLVRYAAYGGLLVLARRGGFRELAALGLLGSLYLRRPWMRLFGRDREAGRPLAASVALMPVVVFQRAIGDLAKMAGYPVGLCWRLRRYESLGWRVNWKTISPSGRLWRPESSSKEIPRREASFSGADPRSSR
jgi:cellulose synthase/poly-beta-1,6-N-acetylglucosamine synthase-like glycosyltransferase